MKKLIFTLFFAVIGIALSAQTKKWTVECNACETEIIKSCQSCANPVFTLNYKDGVTIGGVFMQHPFKILQANKRSRKIRIVDFTGNDKTFHLRMTTYSSIDLFMSAVTDCIDKCNGGAGGESPSNTVTSIDDSVTVTSTANANGSVNYDLEVPLFESQISNGRIAYVTTTGNDATARVGFPNSPYATINAATVAAIADAQAGKPTIDVIQGEYTSGVLTTLNNEAVLIIREGAVATGQILIDGPASVFSKGLVQNTTAHPVIINNVALTASQVVISGNYKLTTATNTATILTNTDFTLKNAVLVNTGLFPYVASSTGGTHTIYVYNSFSNVENGDGGQLQVISPVFEDLNVSF